MPETPMPCDHPGCTRGPTHTTSVWVTAELLRVFHWCAEHRPAHAEAIKEE